MEISQHMNTHSLSVSDLCSYCCSSNGDRGTKTHLQAHNVLIEPSYSIYTLGIHSDRLGRRCCRRNSVNLSLSLSPSLYCWRLRGYDFTCDDHVNTSRTHMLGMERTVVTLRPTTRAPHHATHKPYHQYTQRVSTHTIMPI